MTLSHAKCQQVSVISLFTWSRELSELVYDGILAWRSVVTVILPIFHFQAETVIFVGDSRPNIETLCLNATLLEATEAKNISDWSQMQNKTNTV